MKLFEVLQQRRGRVLFVSVGNSGRSQIAEAFANAFGDDVIEAAGAGGPKPLSSFDLNSFDLIVNLSDNALPLTDAMVLQLPLPDLEVSDRIEAFVRFLVEHFRVAKAWSTANPLDSANALYSERCAVAMSSR